MFRYELRYFEGIRMRVDSQHEWFGNSHYQGTVGWLNQLAGRIHCGEKSAHWVKHFCMVEKHYRENGRGKDNVDWLELHCRNPGRSIERTGMNCRVKDC